MSQLSPSLRKAAVLVATLDEDAAESLLRQMSAEDAAKVRSALVALDTIPSDEQQQVLAEFLGQQGSPSSASAADSDVALELDPAIEAAAGQFSAAPPHPPSPLPTSEEPPFAFLAQVEPGSLAALLNREHPQTAAVIIANLPPRLAAAVLEQLPAALATEALERIACLDQLSPEVQTDLARELRRQLAPHLTAAAAPAASLAHLAAVIEAMDVQQREQVMRNLADRNTGLLRRLGLATAPGPAPVQPDEVIALRYRLDSETASHEPLPHFSASPRIAHDQQPWLAFDDLLSLDDPSLRTVFATAGIEITLLALTGAEPRLVARILRKFAPADAAVLRGRLEHPGPVRLRDIEQAQTALAAIASRLAHEGSITLPRAARFAAAV